MGRTNSTIEEALRAAGAVLVRHNKGRTFRLPNGRSFTYHLTPSDRFRGEKNAYARLQRALADHA